MTTPVEKLPPLLPGMRIPSSQETLRRLFLTLFLRGRSARGLQKKGVPKSIGRKLGLALFIYALFGLVALMFLRQPVFALSTYLHAMTFVFLGMFVASSAGEILFNKEEADILLHRPVAPRTLLWAKVRVLVEVSLWLAGALNLVGFVVGIKVSDGGWFFPPVHMISTILEALFCTASIVLVYQLCLRWFGRERLEGLMTAAQILISVAAVLAGQIVPRIMFHFNHVIEFNLTTWWIALLPPAWFAGLDDAIVGSAAKSSWLLGGLAIAATGIVGWTAFGKLARDYQTGLQTMNETVSPQATKRRRWIDLLVGMPPLSWWLRKPIERASFVLTTAYLTRDRDVKLRVYPGLAPMLIMPFIFLFQQYGRPGDGRFDGFAIAFSGCYLGLIPLMAIGMLQYSQQWQASDVFRAAPIVGPAPICHGARRAILLFLTFPMLLIFALIACLFRGGASEMLLLLPGIVALPVYALLPNLHGKGVPLSLPNEEAKSAGRSLNMIGVMLASMALSGLTAWAWSSGWFWSFLCVEAAVGAILYWALRRSLDNTRWRSLE